MGHFHNELRIRKFIILGKTVRVNTFPRAGIGFRATFDGEAGKWGDSTNSWREAVGELFLGWALEPGSDRNPHQEDLQKIEDQRRLGHTMKCAAGMVMSQRDCCCGFEDSDEDDDL